MSPPPVTVYCVSTPAETFYSRAFLVRAARAHTGLSEELWDAVPDPWGKPRFPAAPQLHFSISHSGGIWMCAFSGAEVGLDLQVHQPCERETLSRRFFHPREDAFLRESDYRAFYDVWAAKESYGKFTGRGLTDGLETFSVVGPRGEFPHRPGVALKLLPFREGFSLCLCAAALGEVTLLPLENGGPPSGSPPPPPTAPRR